MYDRIHYKPRRLSPREWHSLWVGLLFIGPWLLGFILLPFTPNGLVLLQLNPLRPDS